MKKLLPLIPFVLLGFGSFQVGKSHGIKEQAKACEQSKRPPPTDEEKDEILTKIFEFWTAGCKTALNAVKVKMEAGGDVAMWCEIQTAYAKKAYKERPE